MHIWVDADACPKVIKEILYRAAKRVHVPLTLVANTPLKAPSSQYIDTVVVSEGFDVADREIVSRMEPGDLVITADIPLAAGVIEKGGSALDPRGRLYTEETIGEYLSIRNFMDDLRNTGVTTGGPPSLGQNDRQEFANQLDRFLTQAGKG